MKSYLFFLLVFSTVLCYGQTRISGKVVDENTKRGIAGVSVYLNNTTCGTETDTAGRFILSCAVGAQAELVFSHVNYTKNIILIEAGNASSMNIQLSPRSNHLNEVVIKNRKNKPADITKWFNIFSLNLIGKYDHPSALCSIQNPKMLNYYFDEEKNVLHVSAFEPLELENPMLGYKIRIDLENFEYAFATNEVSFKYSCFYEPLKKTKYGDEQIKRNRNYAYNGSALHFMRAVYQDRLAEENFEIYSYRTKRNQEKKRINELILSRIAKAYAQETHPDISLNHLFSRDSAAYYTKVLQQETVLDYKTSAVKLGSLIEKNKASRTINFDFPDTLLVNYVKYVNIPYPVLQNGVKRTEVASKPLSTFMYFFETGGINIDNRGFYPEFRLFTYGDMAERRMANALPLDYEPDK